MARLTKGSPTVALGGLFSCCVGGIGMSNITRSIPFKRDLGASSTTESPGGFPWDRQVGCPWVPKGGSHGIPGWGLGPWGPFGLGVPWALGLVGPWGICPWGPRPLGPIGPLEIWAHGLTFLICGSKLVHT